MPVPLPVRPRIAGLVPPAPSSQCPAASSDRLGWVGLEAAHFRATLATEFNQPVNTHHMLVLYTRPPDELELRYEGVKRRSRAQRKAASKRMAVACCHVPGTISS